MGSTTAREWDAVSTMQELADDLFDGPLYYDIRSEQWNRAEKLFDESWQQGPVDFLLTWLEIHVSVSFADRMREKLEAVGRAIRDRRQFADCIYCMNDVSIHMESAAVILGARDSGRAITTDEIPLSRDGEVVERIAAEQTVAANAGAYDVFHFSPA